MFPFTSMSNNHCDIEIILYPHEQKLSNVIRFNVLFMYFARISSGNKMKLLSSLIRTVRSVDTLSSLMNSLISPTLLYCKVVRNQVDASNYDKILQDHNRMFTDEKLESAHVESDICWFQELPDFAQESILISLLRSAGGDIIANSYRTLSEVYSQRKKQQTIIKESIDGEKRTFTRNKDDIQSSVYLECERQQNEYRSLIAQYRKKIFGAPKKPKKVSKKSKKPKSPKSNEKKSKKSKKSKKLKKGRKAETNEEFAIEIRQLMPIWILKKIMSYLDAKTLSSVKKLDSYWKWVVDDYLKEVKMRKKLNEIHAHLLSTLDTNYDDEQSSLLIMKEEPIRKTFHDRKMENLCQRGAILEKLRHTNLPLAEHSILYDAILENSEYELNARLNSPRLRVAKVDHIPLYTHPKILYKDVGLFGLQNGIFADDGSLTFTVDSEVPEEDSLSNRKRNESLIESLGIIQ